MPPLGCNNLTVIRAIKAISTHDVNKIINKLFIAIIKN